MRKKLLMYSFLSALGEAVYVLLIALFLRNGEKILGDKPDILGIITLLLLFVVSAAISGALVLGKPIQLYLDGQKKEALELFGLTVGWIFAFLVILLVIVAIL